MNTATLCAAIAPGARRPSRFSERLHHELLSVYGRVASAPDMHDFHFRVGTAYAVDALGYDATELAGLPPSCTMRFAGVGNPLAAGAVPAGTVVLDHACGSGTDLLLALRRGGPQVRAIGIDITPGMRHVARRAAVEAGVAERMRVYDGSFDQLPLEGGSIDLALSNGVLNLALDKPRVLQELHRVLRDGGALYLADVVMPEPPPDWVRGNTALWAACIGGALTEHELIDALRDAGFGDIAVVARHKPFMETPLAARYAGRLACPSVTLRALKPR